MTSPLVPAELAFTGDGTPFSPTYGDIYHSRNGGLGQARHVFLGGNTLLGENARWTSRSHFVILETGFGLGLNFLATWQAWRESGARGRLDFISVEMHPFRRDHLAGLLAPYPEMALLAAQLVEQWPPLAPGAHTLIFDEGQVTLNLLFGDALECLQHLDANADAIYLDGFSPANNPDMWSPALIGIVSDRCRPQATLATWCAAGRLRRTLTDCGWSVERRRGFAVKRDMLVAHRSQPSPDAGEASL